MLGVRVELRGVSFMLSKADIKRRLELTKELIDEARSSGLTDAEIVAMLKLKPKGLGKQTRAVLRAIQTGEIAPDKNGAVTTKQVAEYLGKTRGTAIYHLNILRDAGYLG